MRRSWSCIALALAACSGGGGEEIEPPPIEGGWVEGVDGLWTLAPATRGDGLGGIGYAPGFEVATDELGVTLHDAKRAQPGVNLYSSGHAAEARLVDMNGALLHSWSLPYGDIAGAPPLEGPHQDCWRRVRMFADGSLVAIYGGRGLVKIDRDSKLLWHVPERAHHDVAIEGETVWTLTRTERLVPKLDPRRAVVDDWIVQLSDEGEVLRRVSVTDALLSSKWSGLLIERDAVQGERLHTNSIAVLGREHETLHRAFRAGRVLLCARNANLLFVVDLDRRRVEWVLEGPWRDPHDPRPLANGRLLLFDNLGHAGYSRVIELDPQSGEITWEYAPDPPAAFFSRFCGTAARLANGNTLVTETGAGRAFEITRDGTRVWQFVSPHRAGPDDRLVAALFEVERLPPDAAAWLGN